MTDLFISSIEQRKTIKNLGATYDIKTKEWSLPKNKEHLFEEFTKLYLEVPFDDKDEVKKLGGQWDKTNNKWFITKNKCSLFSKWIDTSTKIYLDLPYEFIEDVKKIGGKFDGKFKKWYIKTYNEDFEDYMIDIDEKDV